MHAGQLAVVWLCDMDVHGLTLVDVGATICRHFDYGLLGDFPHCFIQLLQIIWNSIYVLSIHEQNMNDFWLLLRSTCSWRELFNEQKFSSNFYNLLHIINKTAKQPVLMVN